MTDNLRTRIAAVIYDQPNPLSREECGDLADAVIAVLRLSGLLNQVVAHRYVTDWNADA